MPQPAPVPHPLPEPPAELIAQRFRVPGERTSRSSRSCEHVCAGLRRQLFELDAVLQTGVTR